MRISDWSSDVCSSDLVKLVDRAQPLVRVGDDQHLKQMVPVGDRLAFDRVIFVRHRPPEVAIGAPARGGVANIAFVVGARHGAEAACLVIGVKEDDVGLYPQSAQRSEEHTSELQSLMRISSAVFCLKKKNNIKHTLAI